MRHEHGDARLVALWRLSRRVAETVSRNPVDGFVHGKGFTIKYDFISLWMWRLGDNGGWAGAGTWITDRIDNKDNANVYSE